MSARALHDPEPRFLYASRRLGRRGRIRDVRAAVRVERHHCGETIALPMSSAAPTLLSISQPRPEIGIRVERASRMRVLPPLSLPEDVGDIRTRYVHRGRSGVRVLVWGVLPGKRARGTCHVSLPHANGLS